MTEPAESPRANTKPWHAPEWRKMRDERIGESCAQCGSTKPPLVLQHFSHDRSEPPSKRTLVWDVMREYGAVPARPTVQRQGCPQCKRCSLTERKRKAPKWRCIACHHEFDESITVDLPINNRTEKDQYDKYLHDVLFPAFNEFVDAHQEMVERRYAEVLSDYEQERRASDAIYMSGEGTATFCKRCAYLSDVEGKRLCSQCKERYHAFKYQHCYDCLPQSRRDELREAREFFDKRQAEIENALEEAYGAKA